MNYLRYNKRRLRLGIIFNFSPTWMGGVIYILNVIKILESLDDKEKPEIFLIYRRDLYRFINGVKYPYLKLVEWYFPSVVKGNIVSFFMRKNIFIDEILNKYSLDVIFPLRDFPIKSKTNVKLVSWWADLQHKYYPEFFSTRQILGRDFRARLILRNSDALVVSSQTVMDDFIKFFKIREDFKIYIFHFVSAIDNLENTKIDRLKLKYNLPDRYFLVSNQFHKHKNHKAVLLSLAKLKDDGITRHIAFTGKFPAAADSPYMAELHSVIEDKKLQDYITMLGVISRNDQLQIMRHSQAVIQPSLFEGWSTVIEDAKSLQVPVIASNLRVNIEQLGKNGVFFDPYNPHKLSSILADFPERNLNDEFYEDYSERIKKAATTLMNIFSSI